MTAMFAFRKYEGDFVSQTTGAWQVSPAYLVVAAARARLDAGAELALPEGWARSSVDQAAWQLGAYGPVVPVTVHHAVGLAALARTLLEADERDGFLDSRHRIGARELVKTVEAAEAVIAQERAPAPMVMSTGPGPVDRLLEALERGPVQATLVNRGVETPVTLGPIQRRDGVGRFTGFVVPGAGPVRISPGMPPGREPVIVDGGGGGPRCAMCGRGPSPSGKVDLAKIDDVWACRIITRCAATAADAMHLRSEGLLSKWGFWDGAVPDELYDWVERHDRMAARLPMRWVHDVWQEVLVALVRTRVLPLLDQRVDVVVYELPATHNPLRASRVDGVEITGEMHQGRGPCPPVLTPEVFALPWLWVWTLLIGAAGDRAPDWACGVGR